MSLRMTIKMLPLMQLIALVLASCGGETDPMEAERGVDPLSFEERQWVNDHPVIMVAPDPAFPPVEFYDDDGVLRGIAPEYLELMGERLGLEFRYVRLENWEQVIEAVRAKQVDMLSAASPSPQRCEYLLFTRPHTVINGVIIGLQGCDGTLSMKDLEGLRVATVAGYVWQDYIENDYPLIDLFPVQDLQAGINAVSFGEVDVLVENIATASWAIEDMAVTNLHVVGETGWTTSLAFASRNDWPMLNQILEKGLELVSREERDAIFRGWVRLELPESKFTWSGFWKTTFLILGSLLVIIVLILFWNRSLRKKVNLRTEELESNLTERLRLEDELRHAQKLEAIGQLAGGVAHDFNNILQAIFGNITLAEQDLSPDDQVFEQLEEIRRAADRAAVLTRQLLVFGRRQTLEISRFDLAVLVRDLMSMMERVIGEGIKVQLVFDPDLRSVMGDKGQLEQVVMNLCVNARDAMPNGGLLNIEIKNETLDTVFVNSHPCAMEGDFVRMSISDTGTGMDEETRNMVFNPFFTTKEPGKGTGLGLATVYGIITQHNGMIEVESRPGIGSVFHVWLPALHQEFESGQEEVVSSTSRGETILLAEDEDSVRFMLVQVLRSAGYRVLAAGNGREALRLVSSIPGDVSLAVLDVIMPGMNGPRVAELLRKQHPDMAILFISGYSDTQLQTAEFKAEDFAVLHKPFQPDDLLAAVQDLLDRV